MFYRKYQSDKIAFFCIALDSINSFEKKSGKLEVWKVLLEFDTVKLLKNDPVEKPGV